MKNNKGYYSWIHSLKNAAVQSQQKGFEMLKEQREMGGDENLKREFLARKQATGQDDRRGGQNRKDVTPANSDINGDGEGTALEVQADVGSDGKLDGRSRLADIKSGAFPPPSAEHPEPKYTKAEAEAEVRRHNLERAASAPKPTLEPSPEDSERAELVRIAKEAMQAAAKKGQGKAQQREAGRKAIRSVPPREPDAEELEDMERDRQMTIDAQIDRMMGR